MNVSNLSDYLRVDRAFIHDNVVDLSHERLSSIREQLLKGICKNN